MPVAALEFGVQPRDFKVLLAGGSALGPPLDLPQSLRDEVCQRCAPWLGRRATAVSGRFEEDQIPLAGHAGDLYRMHLERYVCNAARVAHAQTGSADNGAFAARPSDCLIDCQENLRPCESLETAAGRSVRIGQVRRGIAAELENIQFLVAQHAW